MINVFETPQKQENKTLVKIRQTKHTHKVGGNKTFIVKTKKKYCCIQNEKLG